MKVKITRENDKIVGIATFWITEGDNDEIVEMEDSEVDAFMANTFGEDVVGELVSKKQELIDKLTRSDYKVIKNYELMAVGLPPEYPVEELHAQRQSIRDEINRLESLIQ